MAPPPTYAQPPTAVPAADSQEKPTLSSADAPPRRQGRYAGINLRPPPSSSPSSAASSSTTAPPTAGAAASANSTVATVSPAGVARPRVPARRYTPVPRSLLEDPVLLDDLQALPSNYSLEVAKTIHRAREVGAVRVGLQMPEGLLLYATTLSDIIRRHATTVTSTVVLADVTYGACCVDDLSAHALQCDLLVHYGHSCLVPVQRSRIPALYVFVHIAFDITHLAAVMRQNFRRGDRIALVATIQFVDALDRLRERLCPDAFDVADLSIPQRKPLSPGELLGCTAPTLPGGRHRHRRRSRVPNSTASDPSVADSTNSSVPAAAGCCSSRSPCSDAPPNATAGAAASCHNADVESQEQQTDIHRPTQSDRGKNHAETDDDYYDEAGDDPDAVDILLYVGDGRFHLESAMIANPRLRAFRYDPYSKVLTRERYAHAEMRATRRRAIATAAATATATATTTGDDRAGAPNSNNYGVVLGTLGRQGSPAILKRLLRALRNAGKNYFVVLLSEVNPAKLRRLEQAGVHAWVQIACPRLSIDWGDKFSTRPLLTPFECMVALGAVQWPAAGPDGAVDDDDVYPMDYYARDGGEWTNYYKDKEKGSGAVRRVAAVKHKLGVAATAV